MDANPYQPPRRDSGETLEQKFAKKLLSFREEPVTLLSSTGVGVSGCPFF